MTRKELIEMAKRHAFPGRVEVPDQAIEEWVINAMIDAYNRGESAGRRAGSGLYPEGG